jgi:hypothetical protein
LTDYGRRRLGFDVDEAFSHVIFYYGKCSLSGPFGLKGSEIDAHFGWPLRNAIEKLNAHFADRLKAILPELRAAELHHDIAMAE